MTEQLIHKEKRVKERKMPWYVAQDLATLFVAAFFLLGAGIVTILLGLKIWQSIKGLGRPKREEYRVCQYISDLPEDNQPDEIRRKIARWISESIKSPTHNSSIRKAEMEEILDLEETNQEEANDYWKNLYERHGPSINKFVPDWIDLRRSWRKDGSHDDRHTHGPLYIGFAYHSSVPGILHLAQNKLVDDYYEAEGEI